MVFYDKNYWGEPKSNPQAPKAPAKKPSSVPIFGGLMGAPIAAALTGAAPAGGAVASKIMGQNSPVESQPGTFMGIPTSVIGAIAALTPLGLTGGQLLKGALEPPRPKPTPPAPVSPNASRGDGLRGILALPGLMESIVGKVNDVANAANQPESVEDLLARLSGQFPETTYSGPTGAERAAEQFAPQFQILQNMVDQTNTNYNARKPEVQSVYDGLVKQTLQGRDATKKQYAQAGQEIDKNYGAASGNVTGNFRDSASALMKEMAALGLNEGAGDLVQANQAAMTKELSKLAQNQQTNADLNENLGANSFAFDTQAANVNRQQGIDAQNALYNMFQGRLGELENQRLGLTAQQTQASNNYDMQIQEMLSGAASNRQSQIMDLAKLIMEGEGRRADDMLNLERFGLEQERLDLDRQRAAGSGQSLQDMNPYQALQSRALTMFGGDPVKAKQAAEIILQAYMENPNATNVAQLLEQLGEARNMPGYQDLGFDFFSRLLS